MNSTATATPTSHYCCSTQQQHGSEQTHFRGRSISGSTPGVPQLSQPHNMPICSITGLSETSISHRRKGSQESVDFPGSLASNSFCSTPFAAGATSQHLHLCRATNRVTAGALQSVPNCTVRDVQNDCIII